MTPADRLPQSEQTASSFGHLLPFGVMVGGLLIGVVVDWWIAVGTLPALAGPALAVGFGFGLYRLHHDLRAAALLGLLSLPTMLAAVAMRLGLVGPEWVVAPSLTLVATMATAGVATRWLPARAAVAVAVASLAWQAVLTVTLDGFLVMTVAWLMTSAVLATAVLFRYRELDRNRQLLSARNHERAEVARELHDVVAHHVTGIVVQAQAGAYVAAHDPERAAQLFAEIEQAGQEAMSSIRKVVRPLRTHRDDLPSMDLAGELQELVAAAERAGAITELRLGTVPAELGPTVVRLTREALANVRKHGRQVRHVTIDISSSISNGAGGETASRPDSIGGFLDWVVTNDGQPSDDPSPWHPGATRGSRGLGLAGLQERVVALGGTFTAGPRPSGGWTVAARLPLSTPTDGKGVDD